MKKFLAITLLASSATAFASDSSIYDVQYLPKAGTIYGFTTLTKQSRKADYDSDEVKMNEFLLSQTAGYSFSDKFTVQAELNYLTSGKWNYDNSDDFKTNGLSDLAISGRYRLLDEAIRLDLIGGFQVALADASIKGGRIDNRYLNGGNKSNIGVQVGQKSESMQWSVLGQFIHSYERTFETSSGSADIDPLNAVQARADLLNKLAEKSFLRTHFTADFINAQYVQGVGGTFQGSQSNYELGTEYQHLCSENLLARVGLDYQERHYDSEQTNSDKGWVLRVGANYQF